MRPWNRNTKSTGRPGELNPGSSDRPSRSVRTVWLVSQSPEPPRQVGVGIPKQNWGRWIRPLRWREWLSPKTRHSQHVFPRWIWLLYIKPYGNRLGPKIVGWGRGWPSWNTPPSHVLPCHMCLSWRRSPGKWALLFKIA